MEGSEGGVYVYCHRIPDPTPPIMNSGVSRSMGGGGRESGFFSEGLYICAYSTSRDGY